LILNHGDKPLLLAEAATALNVTEIMVPWPGCLGAFRNLAFNYLTTPYAIAWDDDDWHAPTRMTIQMEALQRERAVASALLRYTTVDLHAADNDPWIRCCKCYQCGCCGGTILWRVGSERYPELGRTEDTEFAKTMKRSGSLARVDNDPLLYVRTCHQTNVSGREHILSNAKNRALEPIRREQANAARDVVRGVFGWYSGLAPALEPPDAHPGQATRLE